MSNSKVDNIGLTERPFRGKRHDIAGWDQVEEFERMHQAWIIFGGSGFHQVPSRPLISTQNLTETLGFEHSINIGICGGKCYCVLGIVSDMFR